VERGTRKWWAKLPRFGVVTSLLLLLLAGLVLFTLYRNDLHKLLNPQQPKRLALKKDGISIEVDEPVRVQFPT